MRTLNMVLPKYSVLMAVYNNDNSQWFDFAIESMIKQTVKPDEIIIVEDGPVTKDIEDVINSKQKLHADLLKIIRLPKNKGLGEALRIGVEKCNNEYIVRMDADDYSVPLRCEKQLKFMVSNNIDVIGCDIDEFEDSIDNVVAKRVFPEKDREIKLFGRRRTPFAHPGVIMKKSQIIAAGNYYPKYLMEDYDLFLRLFQVGVKCFTIKESLVYMRVNKDFYKRRGGKKYLGYLLKFNWEQYQKGYFYLSDFVIRSSANVIVSLMPNCIRDLIYKNLLRK